MAVGQVWLPAAEEGCRCADAWHAASGAFEAFRRLSEAFTFAPGDGLPGRALDSREPVVLDDLTAGGEFSRGPFAREAGLRVGVAIPVLAGEDVVAVLEFFLAGDDDPARESQRPRWSRRRPASSVP